MRKKKANLILITITLSLTFLIIFTDDNSINNLLMDHNVDFKIAEINTGTPKEELIVNKIQNLNNTPTSANNTWTFPVGGNYIITTLYSSSHKAIDISTYDGFGVPIYAANNGTVIESQGECIPGNISCNGNRGNYIVIDHHNNYYTVYMHLSKINVNVGDNISGGQVIGAMGNTGQVIPVPTNTNPMGGTHLHFCVFIGRPYGGGGYAINPYNLY